MLTWTHPRSPSCVRPQKEPKPWWIKSTNWPCSISCHRVSLKARFFEATSIWGLKIGSQSALLCPHLVCLFISCRLCIMQSIFLGTLSSLYLFACCCTVQIPWWIKPRCQHWNGRGRLWQRALWAPSSAQINTVMSIIPVSVARVNIHAAHCPAITHLKINFIINLDKENKTVMAVSFKSAY